MAPTTICRPKEPPYPRAAGRFDFANLPVGTHDLTFALPGFVAQQRRVQTTTGVPFDLEVILPVASLRVD